MKVSVKIPASIKQKRSSHRTKWAAQFAVASELCKRGYEVALTLGNHPGVDLMVKSPNQTQFLVDVKGQYLKGFWIARSKPIENLFFIFAFVPDEEINQFFVLSNDDLNNEYQKYIAATRSKRIAKSLSVEKVGIMPGLPWNVADKFKDKWKILPP
jgi:hypothetical protein